MSQVYFISHPEVVVDPQVPVPQWDLSAEGRRRLALLLTQAWLATISAVFASEEQKARTAAEALARARGLRVGYLAALGELDRSATGYLPHDEHSRVSAAAFARPAQSIRGWERTADAQPRIVAAVATAIARAPAGGNLAIVSHGGVGTLLLNHLRQAPISTADAPPGQGYYFVFNRDTWQLVHGWRPIDDVALT